MKKILLVLGCACVHAAMAETFNWIPGSTSWRDANSYTDGSGAHRLPQPNDSIAFARNEKVTLSGADDIAFVSRLASLQLRYKTELTIHVDKGADISLTNAIYGLEWDLGTVIKTGGGTLRLESAGERHPGGSSIETSDYEVDMDIRGGDLRLFSGTPGMVRSRRNLGRISVAPGATFHFPGAGSAIVRQLNGGGVLTNDTSATTMLSVGSSHLEINRFSGTIGGAIDLYVRGALLLPGTENHFSGSVSVTRYEGNPSGTAGILGVADFGKAGDASVPSSIGLGDWISVGDNDNDGAGSGCILYLGTGGDLRKVIGVANTLKAPCTLDAGAYGGLNFKSLIRNFSTKGYERFILTGSNVVASTISATAFEPKVLNGTNYTFQLTKKGAGVWRMASGTDKTSDKFNRGLGMVAVDDGVLQIETIDERGYLCALGHGDRLLNDTANGKDVAGKETPYAVRLGSENANAVLEYLGNRTAQVTTRPFGLNGGTSHIRNSGTGALRLFGAGGVTPGSHLFVLDGENTSSNNVFSTITNGVAGSVVSVAKEGSGTWTLSGEQSFSGSLSVKGGTLVVRKPGTYYTWFRWVLREVAGNCAARYPKSEYTAFTGQGTYKIAGAREFALYDATGHRQNVGLVHMDDYATLQPGQSAYGVTAKIHNTNTVLNAERTSTTHIFDDSHFYSYDDGSGSKTDDMDMFLDYRNASDLPLMLDNPQSWIPIVMRLTNGAPEIAAYDIAQLFKPYNSEWDGARSITAYSVEGSFDGLSWDVLDENNTAKGVTGNGRWLSTDTQFSAKRVVTGNGDCFKIRGRPQSAPVCLGNVSEISVSGNATLRVENGSVVLKEGVRLSVDCAGGEGAIAGVILPVSGVLSVSNIPAKGGKLPISFEDPAAAQVGNLAHWTLQTDDGKASRWSVSVSSSGDVTISKRGLVVVIR